MRYFFFTIFALALFAIPNSEVLAGERVKTISIYARIQSNISPEILKELSQAAPEFDGLGIIGMTNWYLLKAKPSTLIFLRASLEKKYGKDAIFEWKPMEVKSRENQERL